MRILALIGVLILSACQQAPQQTVLPPISFAGKAPLRVAVASIEVVDMYKPTYQKPYVEHEFITSPANVVHTWANERLKTAGTAGRLEITIEDASVKQEDLPVQKGVTGFFKNEQSARYNANVKVTMRLYDGVSTMSRAEGDVSVSRSQTINEKATIAEREKLWHDMSREIATAFDREGEARLRQYFANYLR